ncbi:MAG: NINE protein [Bacteroidota bacterium]
MKSKNHKRRLAAIMYTDIVGYSAMMQEDERRALELRNRHREVFKNLHEEFNGTVLQYYGDGTLSIFDSTADAVECAVRMQQLLGDDPVVPLRISVHTGDITYSDEDAYGDGLNVAARLEPLCNPGGVFISGKTYDDIKNHPYLRAESLGYFSLKNIQKPVEIYALSNEGVEFPMEDQLPLAYSPYDDDEMVEAAPTESRKQYIAGLLGFLLGFLGMHRFYLGQKGLGIAYFVISLVGIMGIAFSGDSEAIIMPGVVAAIAFLDALIFLVMPKANFDRKFNKAPGRSKKVSKKEKRRAKERSYARPSRPGYKPASAFPRKQERRPAPLPTQERTKRRTTLPKVNPFELRGLQKYNQRDINGAIVDFEKALETDEYNPAIYFILAKCHSLKENAREAFLFLDQAVELGFEDFDQIRNDEALAFLRSQDAYESYVRNGYRWPSDLPPPGENLLDQKPPAANTSNLLEELKQLEDLYKRGILTPEEYQQQKDRFGGA